VVRPSRETNARPPVDAYEAIRACGTARSSLAVTPASAARTAGACTLAPGGRVTTGTIGALSPPLPNVRVMAWLV
jgi:hypothetical protein